MSVTVWHLDLPAPAAFRPSGRALAYRLERMAPPDPALAAELYRAVGGPWHWTDRLPWTVGDWAARLADPRTELWVAYREDRTTGYFELERLDDGRVELKYFGLMPDEVGQGQGGPLLDAAVACAWAMGASGVYVNTCSQDHAAALPNYQARGFTVTTVESRRSKVE